MKVLVTGSTGRIGRNIYIHLMRNHRVIGLDITPCSTVDYVGDIRDSALIKAALDGVDVVIHAAALHAPHVGFRSDDEFYTINVKAAEQLARLAIEQGVSHFIFTSTTALYGFASTPEGRTGWIDETVTPKPKSIYHHSKIQAEAMLQQLSTQHSLPITVLQVSRCFPEPADKMALFRLNRGIDARDVASAHACAIDKRPSGFTRYIISGKTPFTPGDCPFLYSQADVIIRKRQPELAEAFNQRGWQLPTSLDRVYDASLAQQELEWQPVHGYQSVLALLDSGIAEVLPVSSVNLLPFAASP